MSDSDLLRRESGEAVGTAGNPVVARANTAKLKLPVGVGRRLASEGFAFNDDFQRPKFDDRSRDNLSVSRDVRSN